ncbi:MAG TPA: hypothetical protein VF784_11005 [Anaerolineales bacterium]
MSRPSLFQRLSRKLDKTLAAPFFIDQWIILAGTGLSYRNLDWRSLRPLIPPKDRYWGDPFVVHRGECYYVFIEEKPYAMRLGRIACLTLDRQGSLLSQQVVLERPYHLSYPFLFEHGGELFMIPESAAQRTVELYRCTHFPDRWEFAKNLLTDIYAVDTTHLENGGRHWLFANVKAPGGSSLDALHLFSASDLFSDDWQPHPRNPVVTDIRSARPGGRIFLQDGSLIRPSQDSSRRYGYALKFNRITTLNETDYTEVFAGGFTPAGSPYLATHTFNQADDMVVVDAVLRRRK